MQAETLLLRFEDRQQAIAVLGAIGIGLHCLEGDGIVLEATGETAEFEGEVIAFTRPLPGYHVSLQWHGEVPSLLEPYLIAGELRGEPHSPSLASVHPSNASPWPR